MKGEFISPHDPRWKRFLASCPHDFYHLPEYVDLCARHDGATAVAFYAESPHGAFLAPLLIRPVPSFLNASGWQDCVSPYGYSTPLMTPSSQDLLAEYLESFCQVACEHGIVTAFFRLHPFLTLDADVLSRFGQLLKHGETVHIDLTRPAEEIWSQIRTNHKRDVQKLRRLGFKISLNEWRYLQDFVAIYHENMQRVEAGKEYLFSRQYFDDLRAALGDRVHLCCVLTTEDRVVAGGVFVEMDDIVQYHLGGMAGDQLALSPSKLMCDFMWRWAQERSRRIFHLGGGVGGTHDSLFHFKAGFSKERREFFTYRLVTDKTRNETLTQMAHAGRDLSASPSHYFPVYRG